MENDVFLSFYQRVMNNQVELPQANFNPNQPRDRLGRWTNSGSMGKGAGVFLHGSSAKALDSIKKNGLLAFGGGQGSSVYADSAMKSSKRRSGV